MPPTTIKAPTTESVQKGYWTEGKIIQTPNGPLNIGGGTFEPTVIETGTKLDKTVPELQQKGNAIAKEVVGKTAMNTVKTAEETALQNDPNANLNKALGIADASGQFVESDTAKQLREMMRQTNNAQAQASLNAIQQQYAAQEALMVESQKASSKGLENVLNLGGSSRYAPISSMGLVQAKNRYDMQTLADLHAKEESAKANVLQAQREGNFKLMENELNSLESLRKEKLAYATKIADSMAEQNKEIRDRVYNEQKELQKNVSSITMEAGKAGAPPDVIENIGKSKSLSEAVNAAGNYLQAGGTGIVAEYNFYKKDALSRGLVPLSFDEYQTRDANRKILASQAQAQGTELLTTKQLPTYMSITNKFQADSVMSTANAATTAKQIADQVIIDPKNTGNQLTILYTLVKNLDPNSAVREGELALAQTTQSYLSKFENTLARLSTGRVISPDATIELAKATKSLADKWEQAGIRREKQYKSQATVAGIGDAFDAYLSGIDRTYAKTGQDLVSTQEEAKKNVDDYIVKNPSRANEIASLAENRYTDEQILEYLKLNP